MKDYKFNYNLSLNFIGRLSILMQLSYVSS